MLDYKATLSEIQELYLKDTIPWVIGFSGGKDSTTVLQMVFYALLGLPKRKISKEIHVLCNDTLVENPAILKFVDQQLRRIKAEGKSRLFKHNPELFKVVKVKPKLEETFWVSLIAKGYPSPNRWFRWCTERMKINPTSNYIFKTVNQNGQAIIVLGSRKAESANRSASMKNHETKGRLRKHSVLNAFVYTPIEDMSNNEVWAYLLQAPNPWGSNNRHLLSLYRNASSGGECPFAIETGTQSCGKSRFGCWVCTVVDRDKSMENLINNGQKWMRGLLDFRNFLYDIRQQTSQYVPKDLNGLAKFGPFLLKTRREILQRLLDMQESVPAKLITRDELEYINEFLKQESQGQVERGFRKFVFELPNGKRVAAISDFNILLTPRKRLGPMHLKQARLLATRTASSKYSRSTRVMYYPVSK